MQRIKRIPAFSCHKFNIVSAVRRWHSWLAALAATPTTCLCRLSWNKTIRSCADKSLRHLLGVFHSKRCPDKCIAGIPAGRSHPKSLRRLGQPNQHRNSGSRLIGLFNWKNFFQRHLPLSQAEADDRGIPLMIDADDAADLVEARHVDGIVGLEAGASLI